MQQRLEYNIQLRAATSFTAQGIECLSRVGLLLPKNIKSLTLDALFKQTAEYITLFGKNSQHC